MERLRGYRTLITAGFLVLYAIASTLGAEVPEPDGESALLVTGGLMAILRLVTKTPVGAKEE